MDNQIGTRQPTIDTDTDLTSNTITTTGNVDVGGDLVVGTTNIITEKGTKQDEITTSTDLTLNTLTTAGNISI